MYLVAGITGKVGGAAAHGLLAAGKSVRALTRDPQKAAGWARQGVELRQGDFTDPAAVAAALEGVEGAFLMLPPVLAPQPDFPEARAVIASYRTALHEAPPPRLVLLSSFGSERDHGLGLITATHLMEQALSDFPLPTAIVRAGCFLENFTHGLDRVAETGLFETFMTPMDRAVPMICTADIGATVARLLMAGWSGRKKIELGTRMTPEEVADAMGKALGRSVEARAIPRNRWTALLEGIGLPAGRTNGFEDMWDGVNAGWIDFGAAGTEHHAMTSNAVEVFAKAWQARMATAE